MKAEFIYTLKENDKIKVTIDKATHVNTELDIVEYSGILTGEVIGIEDNIEHFGQSGIYIEYEEDLSLGPKVLYLHYTEIVSIEKIRI